MQLSKVCPVAALMKTFWLENKQECNNKMESRWKPYDEHTEHELEMRTQQNTGIFGDKDRW